MKAEKVVNKVVTKTGYTIDLSQLSTKIEKLRNKYEQSNSEVSFLRSRKGLKGEALEKEIEEEQFKMNPSEFGAIVKNILKEKLGEG